MRNNNSTALSIGRHLLIQNIAGTVIASASVETISMAADSD